MIQSMMGLCILGKLLLMTLLLQPTKENEEWGRQTTTEPENSVRFGEFCLKSSDNSHFTSSKPVTQQSTQSNRESTQELKQPTTQPNPTYWESTQRSEQSTQPDPPIVTGDTVFPVAAPSALHPPVDHTGCRCNENNMKLPAETSPVLSVTTYLASETCSVEYIEKLGDGREVCVNATNLAYFYSLIRRSEQTTVADSNGEPLVTSPAPLDPTTELPTSTQDNVAEIENGSVRRCESCNFTRNLDNVDPKSIQSLNMTMRSVSCPVLIYVSLKDEEAFCLDSQQPQFLEMLIKLMEITPPHEDHFEHAHRNIIDGCRCQDRKKKQSTETYSVKSTMIWPLSGRCNSTEYIETLENGTEICVTASSILEYFALLHESKFKTEYIEGGERGPHPGIEQPPPPPEISYLLDPPLKTKGSCLLCISTMPNWENIDPKDVASLQMDVNSHGCPVILEVNLKNGEGFCLDSSQPRFKDVLKILKINEEV